MNTQTRSETESRTETEAVVAARRLLRALEDAWNQGDARAFAATFAADATFVDIRGDWHQTRAAIAAGHDHVLRTLYAGSTVRYEVLDARVVGPGCLLVWSRAELDNPGGPFAGKTRAVQTIVALPIAGAWAITAFHNTVVAGGRS
jgi:uncharacterized protein (TIGR02246 family)